MNIILASASPRRREILSGLGLDFSVLVPDVDETSDITDPAALVRELAERKGRGAREMLSTAGKLTSDTLVISSDTLVWCDNCLLGKPRDEDDARRMLHLMSGRQHTVFSGIALSLGTHTVSDVSATHVRFADMTDREIDSYLSRCSYMDKAGAYAIQQGAAMFIDGIDGDFFTVMGLPVRCMYRLARDGLGIDLGQLCHKSE